MKLALSILIALQIGDVLTTTYGLTTGAGREGNPIAAAMLANSGVAGLVAAKAVVIAYVIALFLWLPNPARSLLGFVIRAAAIYTLYVVYSNLRVGGLI
jgi:hypothetical protein